MKLNTKGVKKILCDTSVAAVAVEVNSMVREGQFEDWQTEALAELDDQYLKKTMAIATGDRDVAAGVMGSS